jgi:hypothetical protein
MHLRLQPGFFHDHTLVCSNNLSKGGMKNLHDLRGSWTAFINHTALG